MNMNPLVLGLVSDGEKFGRLLTGIADGGTISYRFTYATSLHPV
jgi:hypothetical protein